MDILASLIPGNEPANQKVGIFEHKCRLNMAGELDIDEAKTKVDVEIIENETLTNALERVKQSNLKAKIVSKQSLQPGEEATIKLKYLI